jgi:hypothetical protein
MQEVQNSEAMDDEVAVGPGLYHTALETRYLLSLFEVVQETTATSPPLQQDATTSERLQIAFGEFGQKYKPVFNGVMWLMQPGGAPAQTEHDRVVQRIYAQAK